MTPRLLATVIAIAAAYPAYAQPLAPTVSPAIVSLQAAQSPAARRDDLARILVETDTDELSADGRSTVRVTVRLFDREGKPLSGLAAVTIEHSAGRLLELGPTPDLAPPAALDAPRAARTLRVDDGVAHFVLQAPDVPQDVRLAVRSGTLVAQGSLSFLPESRPMIVVGLAEAVVGARDGGGNTTGASRFNDGFEQEITRWSRQFDSGKANAAVRSAVFAKGDIGGDRQLTLAYDSDKAAGSRLLRDNDPNRFYPVYGDESRTSFDAQSSQRLYARIDERRNYVMFGDFATGTSSPLTGTGLGADLSLNKLGQYSRTVTGLRAHVDEGRVIGNVFVVNDTLRQIVEEYRANGTSGPLAVRSNAAVQNSEKVELLVRDKHQVNLVKKVVVMQRYVDYTFEPFSGRLLFNQPIASLSPEGDPQSVRITYETDQGGDTFWVGGADGRVDVNEHLSVGASVVDDQNPQSPYQLQSVGASVRFAPRTTLTAEAAHSLSTAYSAGNVTAFSPTGQAGETIDERDGRAGRVELRHDGDGVEASASWVKADRYFNNASSGIANGRTDAKAAVRVATGERTKVFADALRSRDDITDGSRSGAQVGVEHAVSERLSVQFSLRHMEESAMPATAGIAPNTAPLGAGDSLSGGFFGGGSDGGVNPLTGLPATGTATTQPMDATTLRAAARYKLDDKTTLQGDAETSVTGDDAHRYGLGAQRAFGAGQRVYGRVESQSGLASAYSLNAADRSTSVVAGVDTSYMQGGTLFSEYRYRDVDTVGANVAELASGVRNTWTPGDGLQLNTSAEYLKVRGGTQQDAVALSGAVAYQPGPLWNVSTKLEARQLSDRADQPGDQGQTQWLHTASVARRLGDDWTLLARNYLLVQQNRDNAAGTPIGDTLQDRAQFGLAWRPRDDNRVNALARYEYKTVRDHVQPLGEDYDAHIVSAHADYHPSRAWWTTTRLAAKATTDHTLPASQQKYTAWLAGGRVVYDVTSTWDVGVLASRLASTQDRSVQYAYGAEVGHQLMKNLYLSLGHNLSGFRDKDLAQGNYTARGTFLRLRFKFDENLLRGGRS